MIDMTVIKTMLPIRSHVKDNSLYCCYYLTSFWNYIILIECVFAFRWAHSQKKNILLNKPFFYWNSYISLSFIFVTSINLVDMNIDKLLLSNTFTCIIFNLNLKHYERRCKETLKNNISQRKIDHDLKKQDLLSKNHYTKNLTKRDVRLTVEYVTRLFHLQTILLSKL